MKTPTYCYHFPRPALTVDMVVWGYAHEQFHVLLIQRKNEPFKNRWAFPGGFVDENETAEQAAQRELMEETHIDGLILEQLYTVSSLNRDPRGRTVSVIYQALCHRDDVKPMAGDDAGHLKWFPIDHLPPLAFDHQKVQQMARENLLYQARHLMVGPQVFKKPFPEKALVDCYNALLKGSGTKAFQLLQTTGCIVEDPSSGLYTFKLQGIKQLQAEGFFFFANKPG